MSEKPTQTQPAAQAGSTGEAAAVGPAVGGVRSSDEHNWLDLWALNPETRAWLRAARRDATCSHASSRREGAGDGPHASMAVMGDSETRLQFITICHNQYGELLDDYLQTMPKGNPLLAQFKRDIGQHYQEKLATNQLRRYTCYLFVGIEPIVEFSERIKRRRKLSPKENWFSRITNLLRDTFELSMTEAANLTEEEWNTAVNVLSKQAQQAQAILKAAGIESRLLPFAAVISTPRSCV